MALANVLHLFPLDNDVNAAASSNSKNTTITLVYSKKDKKIPV